MKRFEYEISNHNAQSYKELIFVCSNAGECRPDQVPVDQTQAFAQMLNERGEQGWELVQLSFVPQGVTAFWKRERSD